MYILRRRVCICLQLYQIHTNSLTHPPTLWVCFQQNPDNLTAANFFSMLVENASEMRNWQEYQMKICWDFFFFLLLPFFVSICYTERHNSIKKYKYTLIFCSTISKPLGWKLVEKKSARNAQIVFQLRFSFLFFSLGLNKLIRKDMIK